MDWSVPAGAWPSIFLCRVKPKTPVGDLAYSQLSRFRQTFVRSGAVIYFDL